MIDAKPTNMVDAGQLRPALAAVGLDVNAVSAWLGHSSPTVTLNTYLVLAPDTLGNISEVL